ncbi:MAG: radical SAM protein [Chloroflexi bacterium]|nr:radical SAM protein [Anaerolineales bacterium]RIK50630.1 MAG: radical SAM protein [Chloroflexota bacterium]
MNSTAPVKEERREIFWELTKSICPECRKVIDARILLRDGKVFIRKRCPDHGPFEALFFGDAELYVRIAPYNKPGTIPLKFGSEVREGCPLDCGLCPDHQQHACLGLIEVNQACNLDCPLCFADAGTHLAHSGFELTYEQVERMIDTYIAAEGNPEVLQFSGGEPSLHPRIIEFIELANRKGIKYVMLNTNGIRIARDDKFLDALAQTKAHVYLQFDGFDERTNELLRGKADLLKIKLKALDRLAEKDMRVVLVAAVERGINEHEIGPIVEFGLKHPAVFGVNFQPAFRAQRHIPSDPLERMTIPDVLVRLEDQTKGLIRLDDFVPVPCCMPTCNFVTYALIDGDSVTPITRVMDVKFYLDYIKNRTMPALNDDLLKTLERLWSSSAKVGSDEAAQDISNMLQGQSNGGNGSHPTLEATRAEQRCVSCHAHLPLSEHAPRDLGRHIFMINTRDFMDPWTFNVKNAMKCCVEFLTPDGRMIPFCTYNTVGYREQAREALTNGKA